MTDNPFIVTVPAFSHTLPFLTLTPSSSLTPSSTTVAPDETEILPAPLVPGLSSTVSALPVEAPLLRNVVEPDVNLMSRSALNRSVLGLVLVLLVRSMTIAPEVLPSNVMSPARPPLIDGLVVVMVTPRLLPPLMNWLILASVSVDVGTPSTGVKNSRLPGPSGTLLAVIFPSGPATAACVMVTSDGSSSHVAGRASEPDASTWMPLTSR